MQQKSGKLPRLAAMSEFDSGLEKLPVEMKKKKTFDKSSSFARINKYLPKKDNSFDRKRGRPFHKTNPKH